MAGTFTRQYKGAIRLEHPLISVIVPCFNYGHMISEALGSVQAQTYQNWECIVVDDGSDDHTREIVEKISSVEKRLSYIYQKNLGLPAARNAGIKRAKGAYIQFLDADDLIEEKKIEHQLSYLLSHPEVDIVYGDANFFLTGESGEKLFSIKRNDLSWMTKTSGTGKPILKSLLQRNMMVVSAPLIRKSIFDRCGLLDETLIKGYEDWDFWIRCAMKEISFAYLDKPGTGALIRYHSSRMSVDRVAMLKTNLKIRHHLKDILRDRELCWINRIVTIKVCIMLALEKIKRLIRL